MVMKYLKYLGFFVDAFSSAPGHISKATTGVALRSRILWPRILCPGGYGEFSSGPGYAYYGGEGRSYRDEFRDRRGNGHPGRGYYAGRGSHGGSGYHRGANFQSGGFHGGGGFHRGGGGFHGELR
jgi:hypothetical protein